MSKSTELSLKRIAIAFTDGDAEFHTLEAITKLAAKAQAQMSGVFIEDSEMLRAAQLPFAREVCQITNTIRPADVSTIERHLKQHADTARSKIAELAKRSGTQWTFEVVRKNRASAVLELAKGTDLTYFATRSTLRQSAVSGRAGIERISQSYPIVLIVDRSDAGRRATQLARQLAHETGVPIVAVIDAATDADAEQLTERLVEHEHFDLSSIRRLNHPSFAELIKTTQHFWPSAVVLPVSLIEDSPQNIEELEQQANHATVIVK